MYSFSICRCKDLNTRLPRRDIDESHHLLASELMVMSKHAHAD